MWYADVFYIIFLCVILSGFILIGRRTQWQMPMVLKEMLVFFLPSAILLTIGLSFSHHSPAPALFGVGIYCISAFVYWALSVIQPQYERFTIQSVILFFIPPPFASAIKKYGTANLLAVLLLTIVFFSFGCLRLTEFASVDEPLWLEGRIGSFWKNLSEGDWEKTDVSDKPGVTLTMVTGPGLLFVSPKDYRDTRAVFSANNEQADIRDMYLAFRLPLLIVITILLPLFYFFLVPLLGNRTALYAYASIALSPLLIGISKIVNPDSLLWIFAPLSFLAYLVFLEKRQLRMLIFSGILLGLALLTKYVANFLIIYFFGYIIVRYLFAQNNTLPFTQYFKRELNFFGIWLGTGLSTFYLLLPAMWVRPIDLITGTILSQAFEKVAPLFLVFIVLIWLDQHFLGERSISTFVMDKLKQYQEYVFSAILILFAGIIGFVLINSFFQMRWMDFMHILASPKSTYEISAISSIFLTNFYPLFFGIPTLIFAGCMIALGSAWYRRRENTRTHRFIFAVILFILLFFLGATVNQVVLINRYQIILYPLLSIVGGIGLAWLMQYLIRVLPALKVWEQHFLVGVVLLAVSGISVLMLNPFPLSFSSALLPNAYTIDIKDMGSGSYEAANYLNHIPNAKNLTIWTDKRGVCKFFVGTCLDGFNFSEIASSELDYVVISTGRESRTVRMMVNPYLLNDEGLIRFDAYYQQNDPVFEVYINGRPGQFVKIFSFTP
ncbi:MAG: ArnT family glycosyltransferase [Minisyncoccota bacterium]